jgi:hypothetical protein
MQNKLMEVYDKSYQVTFEQVIRKVPNREEAKKLLGQIYTDTSSRLKKTQNNVEDIEREFEQSKARHGIA